MSAGRIARVVIGYGACPIDGVTDNKGEKTSKERQGPLHLSSSAQRREKKETKTRKKRREKTDN